MCGICGFIGNGTLSDLDRMNQKLAHRGPDEEGVWYKSDSGVYLGHKRLSVIDPRDGRQPMLSDDGRWVIVYNGEIYNHIQLRKELEHLGHTFTTDHSDTEVLIHGYEAWGCDMLHRLNGMWAFAIYDTFHKELFLSRDRFGKKPLFYSCCNGTFAFASELNALTAHPGIPANISKRSLKKYYAYGYIPAPGSLYEGVYKLPAGFCLKIDTETRSQQIRKYWEFHIEPFEQVPKYPAEEWGEQMIHLLELAVKRRLAADVPLGVFLSGGIDSSSIAALAVKHSTGRKLQSFSIGFHEESFDETGYADIVAQYLHTDHHREVLSMDRARSLLPEVAKRLDEPFGDSSLIPTYFLCQSTRKHVTVALSGDGSDELFAGYDPFRAIHLAELYSRVVPKPIHRAIRTAVSFLPVSHRNMSMDFKIKSTLGGISYPKHLWNPVWLGPLEITDIEDLFQEPVEIEDLYSEAIQCWDDCLQDNMVDKTIQFYTKLYLQDDILVKSDRAGMMNSLEVRVPYLDIDFVDFVRRIPHRFKYRNGQTKYILKKAMEPVLPRSIRCRGKKGFGLPIGEWFAKGWLPWDDVKSSVLENRSFIEKKIFEHRIGKADHRSFLWNTLLLNQIRP
jgi:asparagine synthase (glutamine-hydrolysing)